MNCSRVPKDLELKRYVITGGPAVGKAAVFEVLRALGCSCSRGEIARDVYRNYKQKLGRHLYAEERRQYSSDVLTAFIDEFLKHNQGSYFYNRGIPDGIGWERFFGLEPSLALLEACKSYKYDTVFILDQIDKFEDEGNVIWANEREGKRVHQLIIQGYIDVGYNPIFVPVDFVERRVDFILLNL